jgi:hypothetical protein
MLPANLRGLVLEIEQMCGCAFQSVAENKVSATLSPLAIRVFIDASTKLFSVASSLQGAKTTADEAYRALVRHFPSVALDGVAIGPSAANGALEFSRQIPITGLSAARASSLVIEHANRAQAFETWLAAQGREAAVSPAPTVFPNQVDMSGLCRLA